MMMSDMDFSSGDEMMEDTEMFGDFDGDNSDSLDFEMHIDYNCTPNTRTGQIASSFALNAPSPSFNMPSPAAIPAFVPDSPSMARSYPSPFSPSSMKKRKKARSLPPQDYPSTPCFPPRPFDRPTPDLAVMSQPQLLKRRSLTRKASCADLPITPKKKMARSRLPLASLDAAASGAHTPLPLHTPENFVNPCATPKLSSAQLEAYFSQGFTRHQLVGKGSFSKVYKALCVKDNQWYAIKVSNRTFTGAKGRAKALKELQIVKHFRHPHVLKYVFAWEHNETLYIQTDLCEKSLSGYMSEVIKSPTTQYVDEVSIWNFLTDTVLGLHHIHHANFIHLDIKPANILFDRHGRLKIADFGLAVSLDDLDESVMEGDSRYLAPELLEEAMQDNFVLNQAADIFSLGATFFELVTLLEMPKDGDAWTVLRSGKIISDLIPKHFSKDLVFLIQRMMDPVRHQRPTVDDLLSCPAVKRIIQSRKENTQDLQYVNDLKEATLDKSGFRSPMPSTQKVHPQSTGPQVFDFLRNHRTNGIASRNLSSAFNSVVGQDVR